MDKPLQSENIAELVKALSQAQKTIDNPTKDAKNPFFKSNYATLEAVINVTKTTLASNGLVVLQQPVDDVLVTTLAHESGQWIRSYTRIITDQKTAQGQGSGLTYARRYALAAMINVHQEDDDGNKASEPPTPPAPKPTNSTNPQPVIVDNVTHKQAFKVPAKFEKPQIKPKSVLKKSATEIIEGWESEPWPTEGDK